LGHRCSDAFLTGYSDIKPETGILSTGAIDLQRQVLYVVSATLSSGAQGDSIVYSFTRWTSLPR